MPQQLFMLNICLVSLQPLTMCKYSWIVNLLCIYSPWFIISVSQYVATIILVFLPVFCWEYVNKLILWYQGTVKYLGESVTGAKIRLRKRQIGSDAFIVISGSGMDTSKCADKWWQFQCTCSGFPTGRSEQMIVTSWNDVTKISCTIERGNYQRRAQLNPWAVTWVFWYQAFGSINKPQTLYFSCVSACHGEEHN